MKDSERKGTKKMILGLTLERAAVLGLTVVGMAFCSRGIGAVAAKGEWTSWHALAGYALGAAALVVAAGGAFGFKLPFVADERAALVGLVGIIAVKFALGFVR